MDLRLDIDQPKGSWKSVQTIKKVPIEVKTFYFKRVICEMQHNIPDDQMMVKPQEKPFFLLWLQAWREKLGNALNLLCKRGAEWKKCIWPQPLLFTAIRSLDTRLVSSLIEQGADTNEPIVRQVSLVRCLVFWYILLLSPPSGNDVIRTIIYFTIMP